jgi:hypothetical protein
MQKADLNEEGLGDTDTGDANVEGAGVKDATPTCLRTTSGQARVIISTGWEQECSTCYFNASRKQTPYQYLRRAIWALKRNLTMQSFFYTANMDGGLSCACCTLL